MEAQVRVPPVSLLDAAIQAIQERGFRIVGLLDSLATVEELLYRQALAVRGINALVLNRDPRLLLTG